MARNEKVSLERVNLNVAEIDVGGRSHVVAIGQGKEDVREFGVYSEDLKALTSWLLQNKVVSLALESTGTYRQDLYAALQQAVLKVTLVNSKFAQLFLN